MLESLEVEIRTLHAILGSERDPGGRAFAPLADAYRRAGEPRKAFGLLTDGLGRAPSFAPGHVVAARLYVEQGLFEEGALAAKRALELDPENVSALASLVKALDGAGRASEALEAFETLASLEPEILEEESVPRPEPVVDVTDLAPEAEEEEEPVSDIAVLAPEPEEEEPVLDVAALAPEPEEEEEPVLDVTALAPAGKASDEAAEASRPSGAPRIYTRTLGELYAKQGFLDRAVEVFRQLRFERPDDADLAARLEELESRMDGSLEEATETDRPGAASGEGPTAAEGRAAESAAKEARARERDEELESLARDLAEHRKSQPDIDTPFAWTGEEAEAAGDGESDEGSAAGPSIGRYFDGLLGWRSGGEGS